jgi:hypothetical protein
MNRVFKFALILICLGSALATPLAYFWGFQAGATAQAGARAPMAALDALRPLEALRKGDTAQAATLLENTVDGALARYQTFLDHPPAEFLLPLVNTAGNGILIRRVSCYRTLSPYTNPEPLLRDKAADVLMRFPCVPVLKA